MEDELIFEVMKSVYKVKSLGADQLSDLEEITHRSMMGEYIIYYGGKIAAYICDDRLLVKPVPAARRLMPEAPMEPPYEGAKEAQMNK